MSKSNKTSKVMLCDPNCPYFPDMEVPAGEWHYDKELPYIKRRNNSKKFECMYDGHKINWYKCTLKNKKEEDE